MTSVSKASSKGSAIWIGALALVVVVGVIAVLAARGSRNEATKEVDERQTAPVEVSGDALPPLPQSGDDPAIGQTIPSVQGSTFDGEDITIGPDDGKAKVIVFAAHWCPHCQRELPIIVDHLAESPMPDDVELLTVSTGVRMQPGNYPPSAWLDRIGWTAPVLADSEEHETAAAFGLPGYPYFVAVDADGKVVARASAEIPTEQFDALVEAARTGSAA